MPSVLCESGDETRSPPASPVQSPPRKKFKFSLKLKPKKKGHGKIASKANSTDENKEELEDYKQKGESEISGDLTTNGTSISDTLHAAVPEIDTPLPFAGLANLGNTCYLNAVLQVLRYCPEFLKSLENLDEISSRDSHATSTADESSISVDEDITLQPTIINCIHKLAREMANAEENYHNLGIEAKEVKNRSGCTTLAVRPWEFVKYFSGLRPMFGGYEQHDAQEFLRSLLSLVEEDCVGLDKSSDIQKDTCSMKENLISSSTYDSKVRGGSKYPQCKSGDVIETVAEPTSLTLTTESRRNVNDCPEDQNSTRAPSLNKAFIPKCFDKDLNCPKCVASDEMNMVKRLFEGKLLLQTCCLNCEGVRQRYENFQDISVPVMNKKQEHIVSNVEETVSMVSDSEDESENDVHLSWAISKFASVERLQGENKYFCDSCATLTEAEIGTYFEELPQVLTIHLKRFQTCYGQSNFLSTSWVTKVTKSLHTPQQLSLNKWCSKTCRDRSAVYKLFGVVMHSGMSSCSGHYLSYVNVQLLNEQVDRGLMEDTSESKCSCQDRNPEQSDASGEGDDIKEKVIGPKDDSSMKSTGIGIAKYFQIFRKSKASVQESTNMDNSSCQKDTSHPNQASRSTKISSNNGALQPQENKIDEQTQAGMPDPLTKSHCGTTERDCLQMPKKENSFSSSEAKWLKFDDAEVQEINQNEMAEILSPSTSCYSTPYLLFYFRS